jgi:type II secretory pathway pseudopilin PulG
MSTHFYNKGVVMKKQRKKRSVTLIEIMIVILLIGMIGGALAFNMRGSMDKGRVFKSEQNAARVYDILMMAHASGELTIDEAANSKVAKKTIANSALAKDGAKLFADGWGEDLTIEKKGEDDIVVYSKKATKWQNDHKAK